jgi:hypothetical protein
MRAMQSPWGIALIVIAAVLAGLFVLSASAALFALAGFLVRRSRPVTPPTAAR